MRDDSASARRVRQEPFDELPARIFVPGEPRTGDTRRNPREDQKVKAPYRVLESAIPPLSHRALSAMTITRAKTISTSKMSDLSNEQHLHVDQSDDVAAAD